MSWPCVDYWTVWCLMLFSTLFQLYLGTQCTCPCFPGVFTSTTHSIISKPLAAFQLNHHRNNVQLREQNHGPVSIYSECVYACAKFYCQASLWLARHSCHSGTLVCMRECICAFLCSWNLFRPCILY